MRVFWDTNLFIYLVEENPSYYDSTVALYQQHLARTDKVITSALTLGELLAQPLRHQKPKLAETYRHILQVEGDVALLGSDEQCAEFYARIRAEQRVKQPDAIQLAIALGGNADLFITNDQSLWKLCQLDSMRIQGIEASLEGA